MYRPALNASCIAFCKSYIQHQSHFAAVMWNSGSDRVCHTGFCFALRWMGLVSDYGETRQYGKVSFSFKWKWNGLQPATYVHTYVSSSHLRIGNNLSKAIAWGSIISKIIYRFIIVSGYCLEEQNFKVFRQIMAHGNYTFGEWNQLKDLCFLYPTNRQRDCSYTTWATAHMFFFCLKIYIDRKHLPLMVYVVYEQPHQSVFNEGTSFFALVDN